ncbi:MAG: agmatine deiminase family protein, partial [Chlamydiota bacterium]|nr:agmatine deiminase family protein [Chlamydiota bacterium]
QENRERLEGAKLEDGSRVNVVPLPMPSALYLDDVRLPASYANFYIANAVVLVPSYDFKKDPVVIEILQHLFPGKRIVAIPSKEMVYGLGSIHCVTQQQPQVGTT